VIVKLAIHGLGRIGRLLLRQFVEDPAIEVVAVGDPADTRTLAHLVKYDSVHGKAGFPVSSDAEALVVAGHRIPVLHVEAPSFGGLGAEVVLDCSGRSRDRDQAARLLGGTVRHVIVSSPLPGADATLVMGVNHGTLDPASHRIISASSCTANCLAVMAKVMDDAFGIRYGLATAVHAYTNDQRILDLPHPDLRRARAASLSMIPTTTAADEAIGLILPHLAGRIESLAVRVPTPDVSLLDLSLMLEREATPEAIRAAFQAAAASDLRGILGMVEDEIVSVDLTGDPSSCSFDPFLTRVMAPRHVKVLGWYDNEWGYAARMKDLAVHVLRTREEMR
jgi:glyceraldehyde 3-phosphate dehydrogenase